MQFLDKEKIEERAHGKWRDLLVKIGVLSIHEASGKSCPCPKCGGNDRFSFNNYQGQGLCFCRKCDLRSPWQLIQLRRGISFRESLELIANHLLIQGGADV